MKNKTHFENLSDLIPDLVRRKGLDIGSARGGFLLSALRAGMDAYGIEYRPDRAADAQMKVAEAGFSGLRSIAGSGENLPYDSESFDFVNMAEVLEQVQDPEKVLGETFRVLRPGGVAYISVPNRFGIKDPHYHLYFINWMPRRWGQWLAEALGRVRPGETHSGVQGLLEMHYMTKRGFTKIATRIGFEVRDSRVLRTFSGRISLVKFVGYLLFGSILVSDFHFIVKKL